MSPASATRVVSQANGELTHTYAYLFTSYMRTKFQLSILINKKVGPSAPHKGHFAALRGTKPRICISFNLFYINSMHMNF